MSTENKNKNEVVNNNQEANTETEVVSKEAYSKVSADMHKFKKAAKDYEMQLSQIKAEQEAKLKAELEEKEDWKRLYQTSEEKLKSLHNEYTLERSKFVDSHKVNAVIQSLGGFKKSEYNRFIDVSKIETKEDGSIDDVSVNAEVERIKKEYPELIKQKSVTPLPSDAPKAFGQKDIKSMSPSERASLRREILSKR